MAGDQGAMRAHIELGASLDAPDPKLATSPLGWALIGDQPEVVELLLESGADPSARYGDDNTAMHTAAFFGRALRSSLNRPEGWIGWGSVAASASRRSR